MTMETPPSIAIFRPEPTSSSPEIQTRLPTQVSTEISRCNPAESTRRGFLALAPGAIAAGVFGLVDPVSAQQGAQADWRYCDKCHELFYDGSPNKGRCAAGGGHLAQGFNFRIGYDSAKSHDPAQPRQFDWRFCPKCFSMFWDGDPNNKGNCPAGGGHVAQGLMFGLPHKTPRTVGQQDWRFCTKCRSLFYNGNPNKGVCSAGGVHAAQGINFALSHGSWVAASLDIVKREVSDTAQAVFNEKRSDLVTFIKQQLGRGDLIGKGFTLYDIDLGLGRAEFQFTSASVFRYKVSGSHLSFKCTQPSIAGSYADPGFNVTFDLLLTGILVMPRNAAEKPRVDVVVLTVPDMTIKSRTPTGAAIVAALKFFRGTAEGGRLIQQAADKYLRVDLTKKVNDQLRRL